MLTGETGGSKGSVCRAERNNALSQTIGKEIMKNSLPPVPYIIRLLLKLFKTQVPLPDFGEGRLLASIALVAGRKAGICAGNGLATWEFPVHFPTIIHKQLFLSTGPSESLLKTNSNCCSTIATGSTATSVGRS